MLPDRELWSIASMMLELKGSEVHRYIGRRMIDLAADGDRDSVALWRAVARRLLSLAEPVDGEHMH